MNEVNLTWFDKKREKSKEPSKKTRPIHDELLTVREAQALLKIGRTKLWQLTRTHAIPAYRLGEGKSAPLRYKRSELLDWIEQHRL